MTTKKPFLQIALDNTCIEDALKVLRGGLDEIIDIIEVGTMLILGEGIKAVDIIRTLYPNKLVVADFKCIAPHFGSLLLKHNPDFVTILSCAEEPVIKFIHDEAMSLGKSQQVQIELYGNSWDFNDAQRWLKMGINHIIFSRPRTRSGNWGSEDHEDIDKFCKMNMYVTATGGITFDDLDILKDLPLYAIICGRSVRDAPSPFLEAKRIKDKIEKLWSAS